MYHKKITARGGSLKAAKFLLRALYGFQKYSVILPVLACITTVSVSVLALYLPKLVLDAVEQGAAPAQLLAQVSSVGGLFAFSSLINLVVHNELEACSQSFLYMELTKRWERKVQRLDFEIFISGRGKLLTEKARNAIGSPNRGIVSFLPGLAAVMETLAGLLVYSGIIGTLHPAILLFLLILFGVQLWYGARIEKKKQQLKEERAGTDRRLNYLAYGTRGLQEGKDIRIYSLDTLLRQLAGQTVKKKRSVEEKAQRLQLRNMLAGVLLVFLRDGAAYFYLIYRFLQAGMTLGDFTLYFAAITGLGNWLSKLAQEISGFVEANRYAADFLEFMELGGEDEEAEQDRKQKRGAAAKAAKEHCMLKLRQPITIRFEDVSFSYFAEREGETAELPVIQNLNLTIDAGESIAVVGANGAGKSTFVKLLCGLLKPCGGRILVNGTDSREFQREDYYSLFSAVFQKSGFLPVSIAENIMLNVREEADEAAMWECIRMAGLEEKIKSLPRGADTCLVKRIAEEATELSGGEQQRLLLARALYKNAPVLVLDEPTAALDPIAEHEIYQKYRQLTEGKTSVFISHRLASTRFCDRILLFENGGIAENGTHEELMALDGRYAEMFRVQSRYYQEEKENRTGGKTQSDEEKQERGRGGVFE